MSTAYQFSSIIRLLEEMLIKVEKKQEALKAGRIEQIQKENSQFKNASLILAKEIDNINIMIHNIEEKQKLLTEAHQKDMEDTAQTFANTTANHNSQTDNLNLTIQLIKELHNHIIKIKQNTDLLEEEAIEEEALEHLHFDNINVKNK